MCRKAEMSKLFRYTGWNNFNSSRASSCVQCILRMSGEVAYLKWSQLTCRSWHRQSGCGYAFWCVKRYKAAFLPYLNFVEPQLGSVNYSSPANLWLQLALLLELSLYYKDRHSQLLIVTFSFRLMQFSSQLFLKIQKFLKIKH